MNLILTITLIFAILMLVIAVKNKRSCHRHLGELDKLNGKLNDSETEKMFLKEQITILQQRGGVSESTVLAIAGQIARMENNLYHMEEVPGCKQLSKALERMKAALQAEDYTMVSLLGKPYTEGMRVTATFVPDVSLPPGESVIISVQKPQVNRAGWMIQAASVTVGQNV